MTYWPQTSKGALSKCVTLKPLYEFGQVLTFTY